MTTKTSFSVKHSLNYSILIILMTYNQKGLVVAFLVVNEQPGPYLKASTNSITSENMVDFQYLSAQHVLKVAMNKGIQCFSDHHICFLLLRYSLRILTGLKAHKKLSIMQSRQSRQLFSGLARDRSKWVSFELEAIFITTVFSQGVRLRDYNILIISF